MPNQSEYQTLKYGNKSEKGTLFQKHGLKYRGWCYAGYFI